jgi:hypothetical protein
MVCIYCLNDYQKSFFKSVEHVIPRAFGKFSPNNLVLKNLVCDECNQYFGNTIDFILARDSIEAVDRFRSGIKSTRDVGDLGQGRIQFSLAQKGNWQGIKLALRADPRGRNGFVIEPISQVGFAKRSEEGFIFVPEDILKDKDIPLPDGIDLKKEYIIIANSVQSKSRIIQALKSRNIDFNEKNSTRLPFKPGEDLPVEVQTLIDQHIRRCIAKIAYNYLAFVQANKFGLELARNFMIRHEFSTIRAFIRDGRDASYPLVIVDPNPILADDTLTARQTNGHIVTVNWTSDNTNIVAQASLFNRLRYRVSLARSFTGIIRPIRSGHLFDIEQLKIKRLVGTHPITPNKL